MKRALLLALLVGCSGPQSSDDLPLERIQARSTEANGVRGVEDTVSWNGLGPGADSGYGWSMDGVGDVNGDGYEDVLVGAPFADTTGTIFLYLGSEDGLSENAAWSRTGPCLFGATVTGLGDVNGDCLSDFAAGDACANTVNGNTGAVFVWYGSPDPASLSSTPDTVLTTGQPGSSSGEGVTGVGDVNGDGYGDVAFGATLWSNAVGDDVGSVRLHLGGPAGVEALPATALVGVQSQQLFGAVLDPAGDINGDGYADLLVGSPGYDEPSVENAGRAQLYLGGPTPPYLTLAWTANGTTANEAFGTGLAGLGDVDGDGDPDIGVGGYGADSFANNQTGRIYVYPTTSGGLPSNSPFTWEGAASATLGVSLAAAGDVNGDGYADLVTGGSGADEAYVHLGGSAGVDPTPVLTVSGLPAADLGAAVGGAGDVNGDGLADVLVGGPFGGVQQRGIALLYLGAGSGPREDGSVILDGPAPDSALGTAVTWVGDVNGDGYSDAFVGAPDRDSNVADSGTAWIYPGGPGGVGLSSPIWSADGDQLFGGFGARAAGVGDVNGDGFADWIVGSPSYDGAGGVDSGRVDLFFGGVGPLASGPAWSAEGGVAGAELGFALAGGGDVNGDGYADFLVGAPGVADDDGRIDLYWGGMTGPGTTTGWSIAGPTGAAGRFGASATILGDANGDGFADVAVGAPDEPVNALTGRVYAWLGASDGPGGTADWTAEALGGVDGFGAAVSGAGDMNGDGLDDLIVGAPTSTSTLVQEGAVLLFEGEATISGLSGNAAMIWWGTGDFSEFGAAVAPAGDLDGDGFADIVVGAPGYPGGSEQGAVLVYQGGAPYDPMPPFGAVGGDLGDRQGAAVAGVGDLDGDGIPDLAAGAPGYDDTASGGEGLLLMWRGNAGDARGVHPFGPALRAGSVGEPVAPWGRTSAPDTVLVSSQAARSPFGPRPIGVELEVKPADEVFDGLGTSAPAPDGFVAAGAAGAALEQQVGGFDEDTTLRWRARLRYDPASNPPQLWSPWTLGGRPGEGGPHLRTACEDDLDGDGICSTIDPDADGDGSLAEDDCDDADPTVFPGAEELCDDVDSNCDEDLVDSYPDQDVDGLPDCVDDDVDGDGSLNDDDCAPLDPKRFPGNPETCDGLDNDCDGVVPDDEVDEDGDGWLACDDCDDTEGTVNPGAEELPDCRDTDCDGVIPPQEVADNCSAPPPLDIQLPAGCTCDQADPAGGGVAWGLLALLGAVITRRRGR